MLECRSGTALLVNSEVDSMGGVVDCRVGAGVKSSPRQAEIEKAQAELSQEYDDREEKRRELEFLEKGGNPLDFRLECAVSLSLQSTSLTDQRPEQILTSDAKGSFALTASPHGDSVDSSGRPGGATVCEPSSADNLRILNGGNELPEGDQSSLHPRRRNNNVKLEQSSKVGNQNVKDPEESAIFRPYARRNRSRSNRDGARSSSTDMFQNRGGHATFTARGGYRDANALATEKKDERDQKITLGDGLRSASSNGETLPTDNQLDVAPDGLKEKRIAHGDPRGCLSKEKVEVTPSSRDDQHGRLSEGVAQQSCSARGSGEANPTGGDQIVSIVLKQPLEATEKLEIDACSGQPNGFSNLKGDPKSIPSEVPNSNLVSSVKGLDSESSCTQTSLGLDVHNDTDACTNQKIVDSTGLTPEPTSEFEGTQNLDAIALEKEKNDNKIVGDGVMGNGDHSSVNLDQTSGGTPAGIKEEKQIDNSGLQNEAGNQSNIDGVEQNDCSVLENDKGVVNKLGHSVNATSDTCIGKPDVTVDVPIFELPETSLPGKNSIASTDTEACGLHHLKVADKSHEDSILEEAQTIQAKRKRIAQLSLGTLPMENRRKSKWDYVLEEMHWLANDFAQERLWKISAASQLSHQAAFIFGSRFKEQSQYRELRKTASVIAKAVMQFWHMAELDVNGKAVGFGQETYKYDLVVARRIDGNEVPWGKSWESDTLLSKTESDQGCQRKKSTLPILGYAQRFLKYNSAPLPLFHVEPPGTPDLTLREVKQAEESLFYTGPLGAMDVYRKSMESLLVQFEKSGGSLPMEVETYMYNSRAGFGYQENACDEDEDNARLYYLPGTLEGTKSTKFPSKKRKNSFKSYNSRSYDLGGDMSYGHCTSGTQQSLLMGKRPPTSLHVGPIPTKRLRTASRQRITGPYIAGANGVVQAQTKTDASSGDTGSFQDDHSTLHGGSQLQKSMEVESGELANHLPYDVVETPKPKKKKKPKHLGSTTFEQGWQLDSAAPIEQRDHSKKRLESHQFDSNGNSGLYEHRIKKLKITKQSIDNNFDNIVPMSGSISSPVASQTSNMSNPNKIIRLSGGNDRNRKAKLLKSQGSAAQTVSGSPWSLFEDQALVVLVHDMGPNWELVSDSINTTLHFKCIHRKPGECKERHKILMDRSSSDGTDSAEDSGSSKSYPSTLPGIPKGSAMQLFQRLQGPMEEDVIKSHFEKIILIGQKMHRRLQNDKRDPKQVAPVHNSHVMAISQVCPNNLNGALLTPLDLCETTATSVEPVSAGYQGSHASGLSLQNQGSVASMLSNSGAGSSFHGSPGMVLGNNTSPSVSVNPSVRDGRFGIPRSTSLSVEEHHRMQYNQMLPGRNVQQPNLPVPGPVSGADRGVRMLSGGSSMGMMSGVNRNMAIPRPGYQGISPSSMLNSGNMLSSGLMGAPSPVNIHSGVTSGQGNSMMRSREPLHMMRPGQNSEHQRQMMVPELQMQVTQGNSQGVSPYSGLSSSFPNQTTAPTVQTFSGHPQQHQMSSQQSLPLNNPHHPHLQGSNHATGSQQQAYAIRLAKDRQFQQRYLQQQQFVPPNALMPHGQPQTQLPMSSSVQNGSPIQSQASSQPVSLSPLTSSSSMTPISSQHQLKHLSSHGLGPNPQTGVSGLSNQMGKQRQRQPQQQLQQSGRSHPQQRQHAQSQHQAKLVKGVGRGNMLVQQNLGIDPSQLNGISMASANQSAEKGEHMHLMQGQGLYSGSGANTVQPSKSFIPPSPSNQSKMPQKLYSGPVPPSSKQIQHMATHYDNNIQNQTPTGPSGHAYSASHQAIPSTATVSSHQQLQPHAQSRQNQVNQTQQAVQRVLQQNRQVISDPSSKSSCDQAQPSHQFPSNASQGISTLAMPQASTESPNILSVSSADASQWKDSDQVYDSSMPNPAASVGSCATPPQLNSNGGEPAPPVNQSLSQRQLSGSLPPHGQNAGAHWQQQQQQLPVQQFPTPPPPSQHHQPQEQLVHHDQSKSSQL